MTEFLTPVDIGNRAAQHCGVEMMDATLGFTENSKTARQISFIYGKVRRAELRRNVWRFATRRAILRPIDTNTMVLAPAMWVSVTTYFKGSIVSDASNNLWISRTNANIGNDPQNTLLWEPYFGPLTVSLWDSTANYATGELVYTAAGDGTYNVYQAAVNQNAVHPALPNQWAATTTYFQDNVVQVFPAWAIGTTYAQGAAVQYTDGNWYASLINSNLGNAPAVTSTAWALMPTLVLASQAVPVTTINQPPLSSPIDEWEQGTTYSAGTFVMFDAALWLAIGTSTGAFPNASASPSWVAVTGGVLYQSLIDLNIGNNPAAAPPLWATGTTYALNALVGASDGTIYKSLANGNVGHNPVSDGGVHWQETGVLNPWTTVFTLGGGNSQWLQVGGADFPNGVAIVDPDITYPLNSGPAEQTWNRNVFRLPSGYLRECPQDPKAGAVSFLGAPGGLTFKDWLFEGNYIVSADCGPLMLRFVADVTDVTAMDDMFCEALAARVALEAVEPLTQSTAKMGAIEKIYGKWVGDARIVNGIEVGSEQPPVDDWIACRY